MKRLNKNQLEETTSSTMKDVTYKTAAHIDIWDYTKDVLKLEFGLTIEYSDQWLVEKVLQNRNNIFQHLYVKSHDFPFKIIIILNIKEKSIRGYTTS